MVGLNIGMPTLEIGDVEEPQKEEEGIAGALILANVEQPQEKKDIGPSTPHGLDTTLSSKRMNVVPISPLFEDMVSKCLGKTPKSKRLKMASKINFDQDIGNLTAGIAHLISDKEIENPSMKDFNVEKINLGVGSGVADVHHLEASTKRIINKTLNDEKDKQNLKEMLRHMEEYIDTIHNPNAQPISQVT